ncbi:MAG: hypothetical protein WCV90_09075 [Candidatus Woesearchaeota archaeon]|jgi:hypothetical protein
MKFIKRSVLILGLILLFTSLVSAIDFNPNGDINSRGIWALKNSTYITTQNITVNQLNLTGPVYGLDNKTTLDWTNLTGYPVACPNNTFISQLGDSVVCSATANTSLNWNGVSSSNTTQFSTSGSVLTILESWLNAGWCKLTGCTMTGSIAMGGSNVTNISQTTYSNPSTSTSWRTYVNSTGALITEVVS